MNDTRATAAAEKCAEEGFYLEGSAAYQESVRDFLKGWAARDAAGPATREQGSELCKHRSSYEQPDGNWKCNDCDFIIGKKDSREQKKREFVDGDCVTCGEYHLACECKQPSREQPEGEFPPRRVFGQAHRYQSMARGFSYPYPGMAEGWKPNPETQEEYLSLAEHQAALERVIADRDRREETCVKLNKLLCASEEREAALQSAVAEARAKAFEEVIVECRRKQGAITDQAATKAREELSRGSTS